MKATYRQWRNTDWLSPMVGYALATTNTKAVMLALEFMDEDDPPTAWFVANNMMTQGALNAVHDRGRPIPDDIAIVGFDDMPWAVSLNPPLAVVAQPTLEIGQIAANMLLERIQQPDLAPRVAVLDTKLVIRASCGARIKANWRKEVLSSEGDSPPTKTLASFVQGVKHD